MLTVDELVGLELGGVAFVRNYVELHFDGPVVRCYAAPVVVAGERRTAFPGAGSCDALRALIGAGVAAAELSEDGLVIELFDGRRVEIDFRTEWDHGREALEFVPLIDGRPAPAEKLVW